MLIKTIVLFIAFKGDSAMICPYCKQENRDTAKFCTNCGAPLTNDGNNPEANNSIQTPQPAMSNSGANAPNQEPIPQTTIHFGPPYSAVPQKPKKKRGCCGTGLIVVAALLALFIIYSLFAPSDNASGGEETEEPKQTQTSEEETVEGKDSIAEVETQKDDEEISDYTNMSIGDVGRHGNIKIGLQYVKRTSYLPTALSEEEIADGNEVILGFFEFFNESDSSESVDPDDITCYADGVQINEVESYIKVKCDGVEQFHNTLLDAGCQLLTCQDYEVKKGWSEIKFFYKSDCVWTITNEEAKEDSYIETVLIDTENTNTDTNIDDVIYSDEYDVIYKGFELYEKDGVFGNETYAVFKFNIVNNGDKSLDAKLMGYEMRAYQDNFALGDAVWSLDDKVDNYLNIFDVESIEPGMSSNLYVAFEAKNHESKWHMVYDDGYILKHVCGEVFVNQ